MVEAFEKWLKEDIWEPITNSYMTHEESLLLRGIVDIQEIRNRVKDDFILYRYYMKNGQLIKDCFYMQFHCVSQSGLIRYESVLKENAKTHMYVWEDNLNKTTGPVIDKFYKYVYRYTEDDDLVLDFFNHINDSNI